MDILFYFYFINSFFTLFVIFLLFFFLTSLLFSLYMKNNFFKSLITYFKWGIILLLLLLYVFYEYFSVAHFFFQECHFWLHQLQLHLATFIFVLISSVVMFYFIAKLMKSKNNKIFMKYFSLREMFIVLNMIIWVLMMTLLFPCF